MRHKVMRTRSITFHALCFTLYALCLLLLSGCLLMSGERTSTNLQSGSGNLSTEFVSAEGAEIRALKVAEETRNVQVFAIVTVESGDLRLDILQPDGAVVFAIESRPDEQVTRSALVQTDDRGTIRYRVVAQGARNGRYQLLFQVF